MSRRWRPLPIVPPAVRSVPRRARAARRWRARSGSSSRPSRAGEAGHRAWALAWRRPPRIRRGPPRAGRRTTPRRAPSACDAVARVIPEQTCTQSTLSVVTRSVASRDRFRWYRTVAIRGSESGPGGSAVSAKQKETKEKSDPAVEEIAEQIIASPPRRWSTSRRRSGPR